MLIYLPVVSSETCGIGRLLLIQYVNWHCLLQPLEEGAKVTITLLLVQSVCLSECLNVSPLDPT
jgi:hypothetical protein